MADRRFEELLRSVRRDPRDLDALLELCHAAARTRRVSEVPDSVDVRVGLSGLFRERPQDPALWKAALEPSGLRVALGKGAPPGSWWAVNGRLGEAADHYFDTVTRLPLAYERIPDGAPMVLVAGADPRDPVFLMDRFPVTQGRFERVQGELPRGLRALARPGFWGFARSTDTLPVHHVGMREVGEYLRRVEAELPTAEEWLLAAQGDDGRRYPWGDVAPSARHANLGGRRDDVDPVDAKPLGASPFGCEDMVGNVEEMTSDTREGESLMLEKYYRTVCGGNLRTPPELATCGLTSSWRYSRDPQGREWIGFRARRGFVSVLRR